MRPTRKAKSRCLNINSKLKGASRFYGTEPVDSMRKQCVICLETVLNRGRLGVCDHWFCFSCIYEWSKTANTCPLCKERFRCITKENLVLGCSPPKQFRIKDADQRVEPYADDDYQVAMGLADEETTDEGEPDDDYEPPPTVRRISQNSQQSRGSSRRQSQPSLQRPDDWSEYESSFIDDSELSMYHSFSPFTRDQYMLRSQNSLGQSVYPLSPESNKTSHTSRTESQNTERSNRTNVNTVQDDDFRDSWKPIKRKKRKKPKAITFEHSLVSQRRQTEHIVRRSSSTRTITGWLDMALKANHQNEDYKRKLRGSNLNRQDSISTNNNEMAALTDTEDEGDSPVFKPKQGIKKEKWLINTNSNKASFATDISDNEDSPVFIPTQTKKKKKRERILSDSSSDSYQFDGNTSLINISDIQSPNSRSKYCDESMNNDSFFQLTSPAVVSSEVNRRKDYNLRSVAEHLNSPVLKFKSSMTECNFEDHLIENEFGISSRTRRRKFHCVSSPESENDVMKIDTRQHVDNLQRPWTVTRTTANTRASFSPSDISPVIGRCQSTERKGKEFIGEYPNRTEMQSKWKSFYQTSPNKKTMKLHSNVNDPDSSNPFNFPVTHPNVSPTLHLTRKYPFRTVSSSSKAVWNTGNDQSESKLEHESALSHAAVNYGRSRLRKLKNERDTRSAAPFELEQSLVADCYAKSLLRGDSNDRKNSKICKSSPDRKHQTSGSNFTTPFKRCFSQMTSTTPSYRLYNKENQEFETADQLDRDLSIDFIIDTPQRELRCKSILGRRQHREPKNDF